MKKVVLRGELGKQFGRVHHFDLNTPAEAIRALCANFEGFQQALVTAAERGVGYIVQVGKLAIEELDEIHNPTGQSEEISITPVLARCRRWRCGQDFGGHCDCCRIHHFCADCSEVFSVLALARLLQVLLARWPVVTSITGAIGVSLILSGTGTASFASAG
jgi:hypothetical protein